MGGWWLVAWRQTARYRSRGLVDDADTVIEPGSPTPSSPWVLTVHPTRTVTAPPRWNWLVSTDTDTFVHWPARLAVALSRAAVSAAATLRVMDAAREAAAAAEF